MHKRVFHSLYVDDLKKKLLNDPSFISKYSQENFKFDEDQILESKKANISYPDLILPKSKKLHYDFENSKLIYESMKNLSVVDATDHRFWAYLSHVIYWNYVQARSRIEEDETTPSFVLSHWFIKSLSASNFLRQDISKLWWVAYLTHDPSRKDPYEFTEEAFSMLDYTRDLLPGIQGRNGKFTHALLEFVIENKELFKDSKQDKVRFLMRKLNFLAGYQLITLLDKNEIKEIFGKYKNNLVSIKSDLGTVMRKE